MEATTTTQLPEDVCKTIHDALRPPKHPTVLNLTINAPKDGDCYINIQASASTNLADELDLATLLWTLHMKILGANNIIGLPVETFNINLEAENVFKAVWITWRDKEGQTGISYEFQTLPLSTEKFSGKRRNCDTKNPIGNWDGKLVPFHCLPKDRLIGRKALAKVRAMPDGITVELNAIVTTGNRTALMCRSVQGKLRIGLLT